MATGTVTAKPGVQRAQAPVQTSAPIPTKPLPAVARNFLNDVQTFRAVFAPHTLATAARFAGNALRELRARMQFDLDRADQAMAPFRKLFDRTPVPGTYQYNPATDLPFNYAFIDAYEGGRVAGLDPELQRAAVEMKRINDEWLDAVHQLGTGALKTWIENYFPHIWQDPAAARQTFARILGKRPLEGSKSFLKQRTHQLFREGLAAGLRPVSDNPVDLFMLKHREVQRFLLGRRFAAEMKSAGLQRFVYAFSKPPEGWTRVDDPAFTVHAPPYVTAEEAFDAGMRDATLRVLQQLGVPHQRLVKISGMGVEDPWGLARYYKGVPGTEEIYSKFGGPPDVLWHELGHALDNRYPELQKRLFGTKEQRKELRALADQRAAGQTVSQSYRNYLRSTPEKMAVALQAYIHAPELMQQVAPNVMREYERFIAEHPELSGIEDIRPTLRLGTAEAQIPVNGMVTLGHWYMPNEAAQVVRNYLSPGLQRHGWYNALRSTSNIMNAAQLGLSAFHLGFTSLDAAVSRLAVGLEDFSHGDLARGARTVLSTPLAPFTNIRLGARVKAEVLKPGSQPADIQEIVRALEAGGGRIGMDEFWRTEFTRRMTRAFRSATATGYIKGIVSAPFALIEQTMRPIMDYVVPRQKLGVFADLARRELDRLGPHARDADVREAMAKAWDSVDNRMGQLVYDNLFYNRTAKDLALLAFRAYGWQLGKYRELGGALYDVAKQGQALMQGKRPQLTHRMAYMLALPITVGLAGAIINRLYTGQNPQDWHDYFMPRTGDIDPNGNPQRVNLPSYLKDVLSAKHNIERGIATRGPVIGLLTGTANTIHHQLNPAISAVADMLLNRDFFNTRIFNPDDPLLKQLKDRGLYLGREFQPFSLSNAQKLREEDAPLLKQVLPFFGITPASSRLSMTPAQELASELYADRMPRGAMPRESLDKAKLLKEIVRLAKSADPAKRDSWVGKWRDGVAAGQLSPDYFTTLMERIRSTPLQFQVRQMDSENAMRVWRIASPTERASLRDIIRVKVLNSEAMPAEQKQKYQTEIGNK